MTHDIKATPEQRYVLEKWEEHWLNRHEEAFSLLTVREDLPDVRKNEAKAVIERIRYLIWHDPCSWSGRARDTMEKFWLHPPHDRGQPYSP